MTQLSSPALLSAPPLVRLVNAFQDPYDNAVATARTCYSSKVILPADVRRDDKAKVQRDAIADSTYAAGHHTTLQHAHFQFVLENISRQCLWSFLHAHPFYNSEQVSQRYVAVKPDRVLVPALAERWASLFRDTVTAQMRCYEELCDLLQAPAADAYFSVFPARQKRAADYQGAVKKRSQEVARYILPIATFAHLYHTVSGLTLFRYHRLMQGYDVPVETQLVVQGMVAAVNAHDPLFFRNLEDPLPLDATPEAQWLAQFSASQLNAEAHQSVIEFDALLAGQPARLVDYKVNTPKVLARAVREVLGMSEATLPDERALALALSPRENPNLAEALRTTTMTKLGRTLFHAHYTFAKKLSHSADSQDQRHRMTPASRPILGRQYRPGSADLVVPTLLRSHPQAHERFLATAQSTWRAIDCLLDAGVSAEQALYLLPNAFPIRFTESGDLAALQHKWMTRLCYNAQEEIWAASLVEVQELKRVHPEIARHLGAPCAMRVVAGMKPACPEGERFCGVPVWKQSLNEYHRVL